MPGERCCRGRGRRAGISTICPENRVCGHSFLGNPRCRRS